MKVRQRQRHRRQLQNQKGLYTIQLYYYIKFIGISVFRIEIAFISASHALNELYLLTPINHGQCKYLAKVNILLKNTEK